MLITGLPDRTKFDKIIPKNAFDKYLNTKEKGLFTDFIKRITWTNKISTKTTNLKSKDIKEIQVFKIELKKSGEVVKILDLIDKSIPYHIIFWVEFEGKAFVSTSSKHQHPTNPDNAVIDWTFKTDFFAIENCNYKFDLKISLDETYKTFCQCLTGDEGFKGKSISEIITQEKGVEKLEKKIKLLKTKIKSCKQFNKKVELNEELIFLQKELKQST
jgi:hypothetical protein